MRRRYKVLIILLVIVSVLVGGTIYFINRTNQEFERLLQVEIQDVDLSTLDDGEYIGEYNSFPVEAIVKVTIQNHEIVEIEIIKHLTGQGQDAEEIVLDVIYFQSLTVDPIAGATYSSKVILLAIQDALLS